LTAPLDPFLLWSDFLVRSKRQLSVRNSIGRRAEGRRMYRECPVYRERGVAPMVTVAVPNRCDGDPLVFDVV